MPKMHLIKLNIYSWLLLKEELDFLDMISFPNDETSEVFKVRPENRLSREYSGNHMQELTLT